MRTHARVTVGIGLVAVGIIAVAANLAINSKSAPVEQAKAKPPERVAAVMPECGDKATTTTTTDNPEARAAAQRGLDFLGRVASEWTRRTSATAATCRR